MITPESDRSESYRFSLHSYRMMGWMNPESPAQFLPVPARARPCSTGFCIQRPSGTVHTWLWWLIGQLSMRCHGCNWGGWSLAPKLLHRHLVKWDCQRQRRACGHETQRQHRDSVHVTNWTDKSLTKITMATAQETSDSEATSWLSACDEFNGQITDKRKSQWQLRRKQAMQIAHRNERVLQTGYIPSTSACERRKPSEGSFSGRQKAD